MKSEKKGVPHEGSGLSEDLSKRLAAYALAAGAAGVGALALAVPAEAGIISHSVSLEIPCNSTTQLDIAGPVHLSFFDECGPVPNSGGIGLAVGAEGSIAVAMSSGIIAPYSQGPLPVLLAKGSPIGSRDSFRAAYPNSRGGAMARSRTPQGHWGAFGPPNRGYLGFEFGANSKHFGWVALSVLHVGVISSRVNSSNQFGFVGLIKGYAYDTIAGKTIDAGQTVPEPTTLSLLALGAVGLFALRKRKLSAVRNQQSASS
jgi:PEP-CTERM motif